METVCPVQMVGVGTVSPVQVVVVAKGDAGVGGDDDGGGDNEYCC